MMEHPYEEVKVHIKPARGIDVGAGKGEELESVIYGGVVGLIFDGRNRPITLPKESDQRIDSLLNWSNVINNIQVRNLTKSFSYRILSFIISSINNW